MEATFRGNPQLYWLLQIWNILGPEILKPLLEEIMKLKFTRVVMVTTYGRKSVDRIATQSMSKICNLWPLIVVHCDYAES